MTLSEAELELIEIIRHQDTKHFTITIHVDDGRWNTTLEDHDSGIIGSGSGSGFDSAWNDIVDPRLRSS